MFLQSIYEPTNVPDKTQFMKSIELLHVLAPEFHPR